MNSFRWIAAWWCTFVAAVCCSAYDLSRIERRILKEPAYTATPKYCLVAFGLDVQTRVWVVHDGNVLYVDRNANGDLSEDGERIVAKEGEHADSEEGYLTFEAGDIRDGNLTHKNLLVSVERLDTTAKSVKQVEEYLAAHPGARGYYLRLDVEIPGWKGEGLGGRVVQAVQSWDASGILKFGARPEDAPILHLGGPWQVTLFGWHKLTIGRTPEIVLGVGTPGHGEGTTAYVAYEGVIPKDVHPTVQIMFPPAHPGEAPVKELHELKGRCCTYFLLGSVHVPDTVGTGMAKVLLALDSWKKGHVAPSVHEVPVVAPAAALKLEAVSPRLKGELWHPSRKGVLGGLRYSPDGKRLIAGDYPGGGIQVWDAETGRQLTKIETGYGYRGDRQYFHVAPDWSVVYATRERQKVTPFEKDGRKLNRWESAGDVRAWCLSSGELRATYQHVPPRGIRGMELSSDGSMFATYEELSGEYEGRRPHTFSLWDVNTRQPRELPGDVNGPDTFSPDGKLFAVASNDDDHYGKAIKLFDPATLEQKVAIPISERFTSIDSLQFTPDGMILIGATRKLPGRNNWATWDLALGFWDTTTGRMVAAIVSQRQGSHFSDVDFSPDGRLGAVVDWREDGAELQLLDILDKNLRSKVALGKQTIVREPVFSPDGKWVAVVTQEIPEDLSRRREPEVDELPQPRIHLVEVVAAAIRETIVAPLGIAVSVAFSPDGRTLASGGDGRVLLWDLTPPLGAPDSGGG